MTPFLLLSVIVASVFLGLALSTVSIKKNTANYIILTIIAVFALDVIL